MLYRNIPANMNDRVSTIWLHVRCEKCTSSGKHNHTKKTGNTHRVHKCALYIVLDITVDLALSLFSVFILPKCYFKVIIVIISMYVVSPFFAVMLYNV